jgi:site-specific recombinase XerD
MAKKKVELTAVQAVGQWIRHCGLNLRDNTVAGYEVIGRQFIAFIGPDRVMRTIAAADIEDFLLAMRAEVVTPPGAAPRPPRKRSAKTLQNMHTGLGSLWTWALKAGVVDEHVVQQVDRPTVTRKPVRPLTADEAKRLIRACETNVKGADRPTAVRDKMLIGLLLDACLRVTEAANLRIADVKLARRGGELYVRDGKGGKDRIAPLGRRSAAAIAAYLLTRPDAAPDEYLLINELRNHGQAMTRDTIGRLVSRIGDRAGVDVYPHLLRTTGACMMVQNGASAWELQRVMGHSEIMTTQRYVEAAQIDLAGTMARTSPMDNLRL